MELSKVAKPQLITSHQSQFCRERRGMMTRNTGLQYNLRWVGGAGGNAHYIFISCGRVTLQENVCPSIHQSVRRSVVIEMKWKNERYRYFFDDFYVRGWGMIGYPCPLVRNDIVTPRHLLTDVST